jgi:cellulose synthase/poly-beta-1,6-N-acetylglucosamine synthase-like glycosyltransferase
LREEAEGATALAASVQAWELQLRRQGRSAYRLLSSRSKVVIGGSVAAFVLLCAAAPLPTAIALTALVTAAYLASTIFKATLLAWALGPEHTGQVIDAAEVAALDPSTLPTYTILVPLYHEGKMVSRLVGGLGRLAFPTEKLDVKLLLETDDDETIEAVRVVNLPSWVEPVIVPPGYPKTKPRACNYGLAAARGEYLVIYDAEDQPDPDQLKKAVVAFRRVPDDVVCIQAKLNYYNPRQNVLTRLFAVEYATCFDLFLPGLNATGSPVPLGGTSNHFRTSALRTLAGWDAWNVTEDCDLGTRLYAAGMSVDILDSTTLEEANSRTGNWIRQRSRWIKGYIQTYWVHTRRASKLVQEFGWARFAAFQLFVGGSVLTLLLNPILWLLTAAYFLTRYHAIEPVFPAPVYYAGLLNLIFGNFLFVYVNLFGPIQRGDYGLAKFGLLMPYYWVLMSIAAWKGALQLLTRPHFWEKTQHGLWPEGQAGGAS